MKTVAIVACSNGQKEEYRSQNEELARYLEKTGHKVLWSNDIYEKNAAFSGTGAERAAELMRFFNDPEVEEIYDISGGDLANQVLDGLDYAAIGKSRAVFWGYSDLTTVINAIYAQTGKSSVLYQVKNMVWGEIKEVQRRRFENRTALFDPQVRFVQGEKMEGVVVGGNIRCFLKLAGTRYFPDLWDKILLLEAYGGEVPQMATYLAQLKQLGAFEKVGGILLGTFTAMEAHACSPDITALVKEAAGTKITIAKTQEIGHGNDAKATDRRKDILRGDEACRSVVTDAEGDSWKPDEKRDDIHRTSERDGNPDGCRGDYRRSRILFSGAEPRIRQPVSPVSESCCPTLYRCRCPRSR